MSATAKETTPVHPHVEMLHKIYADLTQLAEYAADDIVLHRADRAFSQVRTRQGKQAVLAHEQELIRATGNTLVMDVEHVAANDHFGAVLGVLRAQHPQPIAMPFCGLWRFANGQIVEHWENAYDAKTLQHLLTSD